MSQSIEIACLIKSVGVLFEGLQELNLANQDLRQQSNEKRLLKNCHGEEVKIDFLVKNEVGEKIGIKQTDEGNYEFVVEKESATSKATTNKIVQSYARLKILNDVKKRGYAQIKEEKLANGSIRLVVEKWQ